MKMDKALAKEERMLKVLERTIESENQKFEEFLKENERKSVEARTLSEREEKSKREKNLQMKKLAAEIGSIKSEIANFEEILIDYKRYQEFLFKISPPEWQEEQRAKAWKDAMLEALSEKVAEVHRSCVDDRVTNLSTLERVVGIENRVLSLLQSLEDVPQDRLDMIKKVKDSEKRSRQREEKLREQKEKQQERMKKYLERSLADSKKISGRKLMPRCFPVAQKVKVTTEDSTAAEEDIQEYLFGSEDTS
uniref:Coiled-coil domain containing 37 n=1 Tax=Nothobranchius furzeri TaxID=105023 RepID=A0A1A7ZF40_NOTFU